MAETVRARAEELRTRVRTRIEEVRGGGGSSSPILGKLGILKGPLVAAARERIETVTGGGFFGGKTAETAKEAPAAPPAPERAAVKTYSPSPPEEKAPVRYRVAVKTY